MNPEDLHLILQPGKLVLLTFPGGSAVGGEVVSVNGSAVILRNRTGQLRAVALDAVQAVKER